MFVNNYVTFLVVAMLFAVGVSLGITILNRRMAKYCELAYSAMLENTIDALSTSKLADLERSLTELWDSHSSLLASHKRLRSKYGMAELRERKKELNESAPEQNGLDLPDDEARKAAYKAQLRRECKEKGLLR